MTKRRQRKTAPAPMRSVSKRGVVGEGKPLLWPDPVKFAEKIDEYFRYCDQRTADKTDDDGSTVTYPNPQPYSVAGLTVWMGFGSRDWLTEYGKRPAYADAVKRARTKIDSFWEERLADKAPVGAIFWLKNNSSSHDYRDQVDHNVSGGMTLTLDSSEAKALGMKTVTHGRRGKGNRAGS